MSGEIEQLAEIDAMREDCAHDAAWIEEGDESGSSGWWRCATCGQAEQEVAGRG
jgi:hypothetical protein